MLNTTPYRNRPARRRSGSVLVIVVAVLTLLAMIGTAYIATARYDRVATQEHVRIADVKTDREQKTQLIQEMTQSAVGNGTFRDIVSPATSEWLADRTPRAMPYHSRLPALAGPGDAYPMWRYLTGKIDPSIPDNLYHSPWLPDPSQFPGYNPFYARYLYVGNYPTGAGPTRLNTAARPTSITINYLNNDPNIPQEYWGKSRTYPAIEFVDPTNGALVTPTVPGTHPGPHLAADADGDGIADSMLWRLSDPLDGVTYFAAVRVVDNAAAINVNTAWSRDFEYVGASGNFVGTTRIPSNDKSATPTPGLFGTFPAHIGLRELFIEDANNNGFEPAEIDHVAVVNQMREINEFRFGFPSDYSRSGLPKKILENEPSDPKGYLVLPRFQPLDDSANLAARTDLPFDTAAEALFMQMGRRLYSPAYNFPPAGNATNRFLPFSDYDAASLAYRFSLARFDESAGVVPGAVNTERGFFFGVSTLERQTLTNTPLTTDALVKSASNVVGTNILPLNFFPADASVLWFRTLNFDNPQGRTNYLEFAFNPTTGAPVETGRTRFRSPRPLLTTTNAITNYAPVKLNPWIDWDSDNFVDNFRLHPGMIYGDLFNFPRAALSPAAAIELRYKGVWQDNVTYFPGDIIVNPNDTLIYACRQTNVKVTPKGNTAFWMPQPAFRGKWNSSDTYQPGDIVIDATTNENYICLTANNRGKNPKNPSTDWDYQPAVSGRTKTSINTAAFPELWTSFYKTMAGDRRWLSIRPNDPTDPTGAIWTRNAINWSIDATITPFDLDFRNGWTTRKFRKPTDASPATAIPMQPPQYPDSSIPNSVSNHVQDLENKLNTYDPYQGMKLGGSNTPNLLRMFRSPIRDPRTPNANLHRLTPTQVMTLRSALAAVNTLDLLDDDRDSNDTITSRTITLHSHAYDPGSNRIVTQPQFEVTVYGLEKQPFITEVFANNDSNEYTLPLPQVGTIRNPDGYVAIELYNPHNVDIPLDNWEIAYRARRTTDNIGSSDALNRLNAGNHFHDQVIPAKGYLLIENLASGGAQYRPPAIVNSTGDVRIGFRGSINLNGKAATNVTVVTIPNLGQALGYELIVLRPLGRAGTAVANVGNMVPVDQFDFTGLTPTDDGEVHSWHYLRRNQNWKMVYPGKYDASPTYAGPRHQGVKRTTYNPDSGDDAEKGDPWSPTDTLVTYGIPDGKAEKSKDKVRLSLGEDNDDNAYYSHKFSIPLNVTSTPGPHSTYNATEHKYPYGGFARNGDLLQIPFIGAYTIRLLNPATGTRLYPSDNVVLEMNSVTIDAAFAQDTFDKNDDFEQIGRFCPIGAFGKKANGEFDDDGDGIVPDDDYRSYDWASSLFDYFDVQLPSDDYLPNTSPKRYTGRIDPVASNGQSLLWANKLNDDDAATHGKININTASAKVLSMLPLVTDPTSGLVDVKGTENLARAIVNWRDAIDPATGMTRHFASIADLNAVPKFANAPDGRGANTIDTSENGTITNVLGDLTTPNTVKGDYEARYLALTRISNLVTTRSDSFTAYIVVQGWRNAGTPYPALEWEQRKAFIIDRSALHLTGGQIKVIPVPTD